MLYQPQPNKHTCAKGSVVDRTPNIRCGRTPPPPSIPVTGHSSIIYLPVNHLNPPFLPHTHSIKLQKPTHHNPRTNFSNPASYPLLTSHPIPTHVKRVCLLLIPTLSRVTPITSLPRIHPTYNLFKHTLPSCSSSLGFRPPHNPKSGSSRLHLLLRIEGRGTDARYSAA